MQVVDQLLALSGIGTDRVKLRWVSAAEGQIFANLVKELSQVLQDLGPFDPAAQQLKLGAVEGALNAPRLRWLMGMERQLTERENVYHAKLSEQDYRQLLTLAVEEEYRKALILEVLKGGPRSVREIAGQSGLQVYTVSQLLGEIEKAGQAELHGYEGTTPKFAVQAA
jgi:F420-non-reducing hydrogenase iron-sulfur subunit